MSNLETAGYTLFMLVLFLGIFAIHLGLPGTILIFLDTLVFAGSTGFEPLGPVVLVSLFFLVIVAEGGDFWLTSMGPQKFPSYSLGQGLAVLAAAVTGAFLLGRHLQGLGLFAGFYLGGLAGSFTVQTIRDVKLKPAFRSGLKNITLSTARSALRGLMALFMTVIALSSIYTS